MAKYDNSLRSLARLGLAVSDESRLRLLAALQGRCLCVCQLTELLGLAPSTVSKHLSILKDAGLVRQRKQGRWVYHELCAADCPCHPILSWTLQQLSRDATAAQDRTRLKQILTLDPEELCRRTARQD